MPRLSAGSGPTLALSRIASSAGGDRAVDVGRSTAARRRASASTSASLGLICRARSGLGEAEIVLCCTV